MCHTPVKSAVKNQFPKEEPAGTKRGFLLFNAMDGLKLGWAGAVTGRRLQRLAEGT
eukprot:CAMPEP_0117675240 /NCGR_PEP_ID=MMETSP0804-20121206/15495_1 /TAXON_ID=1074897 /ORGANISM="Tetraselmis astigmatica, Strain CCMP880" /LENGTH=55 /DNA_ID=CAMNT_0005484221 /DNA_START=409 /DNA_END=576 /DNA_ORIENTATION=-